MRVDYFKQGLDVLGKSHFNRLWPEESIKAIAGEVEPISEKALVEAVKRMRVELSPSSFPALKRVLEFLNEEQVKINLAQSPPEPKPRREIDKEFSKFGENAGKHAQRAMAICLKIASGEFGDTQAVEACEHMEKVYPGVGWRDTMLFYIHRAQERAGVLACE